MQHNSLFADFVTAAGSKPLDRVGEVTDGSRPSRDKHGGSGREKNARHPSRLGAQESDQEDAPNNITSSTSAAERTGGSTRPGLSRKNRVLARTRLVAIMSANVVRRGDTGIERGIDCDPRRGRPHFFEHAEQVRLRPDYVADRRRETSGRRGRGLNLPVAKRGSVRAFSIRTLTSSRVDRAAQFKLR